MTKWQDVTENVILLGLNLQYVDIEQIKEMLKGDNMVEGWLMVNLKDSTNSYSTHKVGDQWMVQYHDKVSPYSQVNGN